MGRWYGNFHSLSQGIGQERTCKQRYILVLTQDFGYVEMVHLNVAQGLEKHYLSTESLRTSAKRSIAHLRKPQENNFMAKFHINYSTG